MSKAIGRIYGIGTRSPYGYETDYMKYLQGYSPYDYEQTLRNMSQSYADVSAKPEYNLNTAMQGNDYSLNFLSLWVLKIILQKTKIWQGM